MPKFIILTQEHRMYSVKAKNQKEAQDIIENADLTPKSTKVDFITFGDFDIVKIQKG